MACRDPAGGTEATGVLGHLHYLVGCAFSVVLGLVMETIALAVGSAFVFGYAFTMVPLFRGGMACRSAARVELPVDATSIAIMESAFEPQTVCTRAAPESDAIASTNASNTRPAEVPETNPALVELHHKVLAARRQAEIVTARTLCGVFRKRDALKGCRDRDRASQQSLAVKRSNAKKRLTFQAWQIR